MQASLQTTTDEWVVDKFWTHMEGKHVQGQAPPACTQPIQGMVRSGIRDLEGMVWWWGERKNLFLRFRLRLFRGGVLLGWLTIQKRQAELEPLDACHEGYRERKNPDRSKKGVPRQPSKQNILLCLVMGGGTQAEQWWSASTTRPDKGG